MIINFQNLDTDYGSLISFANFTTQILSTKKEIQEQNSISTLHWITFISLKKLSPSNPNECLFNNQVSTPRLREDNDKTPNNNKHHIYQKENNLEHNNFEIEIKNTQNKMNDLPLFEAKKEHKVKSPNRILLEFGESEKKQDNHSILKEEETITFDKTSNNNLKDT